MKEESSHKPSLLQRLILEKPYQPQSAGQPQLSSREATPPDVGPYRDAETTRLKELVEQRDNEISILIKNKIFIFIVQVFISVHGVGISLYFCSLFLHVLLSQLKM